MSYTPLPLRPLKLILVDIIEFTLAFGCLRWILLNTPPEIGFLKLHWLVNLILIVAIVICLFIFRDALHNKFIEIITRRYPKLKEHSPTYSENLIINFVLFSLTLATIYIVFMH